MKLVKGIYFPDSDSHFENMIDDEGNYQRNQFDAVLKYIKPEDRGLFIDVGAHVGLWSRMAIKAGFEQVLAFEPDKDNFECFVQNLKNLNFSNYSLNPGALSDKTGIAYLHKEKEDNSGAKSLQFEEGKPDDLIYTHAFDDFIEIAASLAPGEVEWHVGILIKIDVQGYEAKVVRGMTNFIKEHKPIIIVEQWLNGQEDLEATRYCESLGMKILDKIKKEIILGW